MTRAYLALVALLAVACGSDSADPAPASTVCASGQQVACACADGSTGEQACKADGSGYEACGCGAGGAGGSAGSSGSGGSSGTAGTGGGGGTAGSDPLPAGVYQLSCLWRPYNSAAFDPSVPARFRLDITGPSSAAITVIPFDGTSVDGLASSPISASTFSIQPDGSTSLAFPAFAIQKDMTLQSLFTFGVEVSMTGHASDGAACLEMSGSIMTTGNGAPFDVDVTSPGDICVVQAVDASGAVAKPAASAYDCSP